MQKINYFSLIICFILSMSGCYNHIKEKPQFETFIIKDFEQVDSLAFLNSHHYSRNYNFVVKADSLKLYRQLPELISEKKSDTLTLHRHDNIVVVDIATMESNKADSVWVQVARDQNSFGWIPEKILLDNVMPNDPISQFISFFSDTHLLAFLLIISLIAILYILNIILRRNAKVVHFNDIDSIYPTLLATIVAVSATFYSSIQVFTPETWRHFYYHPTLNPFSVNTILSMFLCSIWAMIIIGVAALDDVLHKLPFAEAILYFGGLVAICAINYIVFSVSTLYYIGYVLLVIYIYFAFWCYIKYSKCNYLCGNCNASLHKKGRCPYCGTFNN